MLDPASAWVVVAVAVLGACSPGGATTEGDDAAVFAQLVEDHLEQARQHGASEDQLALLETARVEGDASLELIRSAAHATVACIGEAGLSSRYVEQTTSDRWVLPGFTVEYGPSLTEAETDAVADQCGELEYRWIYQLYESQPRAKDASDAFVHSRAEQLRACLEGHGFATNPHDDGLALADQALTVLSESNHTVDCFDEAGIDVYR